MAILAGSKPDQNSKHDTKLIFQIREIDYH
jgi:hypothetical protein